MPSTRVRFREIGSDRILHLDLSYAKTDEVLKVIDHAKPIIAAQEPGSLRVLTDVTEARFDTEVGGRLKEFTAHNKPFIRASAVVGVTGLKKIIYDAINAFSSRNIRAFGNEHEAVAWLRSQ